MTRIRHRRMTDSEYRWGTIRILTMLGASLAIAIWQLWSRL